MSIEIFDHGQTAAIPLIPYGGRVLWSGLFSGLLPVFGVWTSSDTGGSFSYNHNSAHWLRPHRYLILKSLPKRCWKWHFPVRYPDSWAVNHDGIWLGHLTVQSFSVLLLINWIIHPSIYQCLPREDMVHVHLHGQSPSGLGISCWDQYLCFQIIDFGKA